jgi:pimeloyl-ACP methyl ester carboxylesterase
MVVVIVVAVVLGLLWSLQRRLIYFPDPAQPPPAAAVLPGGQDVALRTDDGLRLGAWLVPPQRADRRAAVLVAPGNAGNRRDRRSLAVALAAEGFTVLLLDYRGYGGNPGSPSEAGLALDARAAWDHLTGAAGFAPERVILFGESLGAAVAAGLASRLGRAESGPPPPAGSTPTTPGGLVLRSPFTSLAAVGRAHYPLLPVATLLRDRYDVLAAVAAVTAPTAIVYGTADTVVPATQSAAVATRAGNAVRTIAVAGVDHNDAALVAGPHVVEAVLTVAAEVDAG